MSSPLPPDGQPGRGLSGLAIAGIGCSLLLVIVLATVGIFVFVGVKKINSHAREFFKDPDRSIAIANARQNQDIVVLKVDEEKREITFRDKQTGEERTLSFVAAAARKFATTDENGAPMEDSDATRLPTWVPQYPTAQARGGGSKKVFEGKVTGVYFAHAKDAPSKVVEYYDSALKALGFQTHVSSNGTPGNEENEVTATSAEGARKVRVSAHFRPEATHLVITYEGAK